MIARIVQALTSRAAGPTATAVAFMLAAIFAASWTSWQAERTRLEARIAELGQQSDRSTALWRAQLAACHAAAGTQQQLKHAEFEPTPDAEEAARRLLAQAPEGIDVCARMESADQAVLSTLK